MIELTLSHDGNLWSARNDVVTVAAPTLDELDLKVGKSLVAAGLARSGETTRVFMAFDNAVIPQWIRQYAQHYFNRIVDIRAGSARFEKEE